MRVTFCGHKEVADRDTVERWLYATCTELIENGTEEFYLGGYGGFDQLCAAVLRDLKKPHPQIRLILVLPYLNSSSESHDRKLFLHHKKFHSILRLTRKKYAIPKIIL